MDLSTVVCVAGMSLSRISVAHLAELLTKLTLSMVSVCQLSCASNNILSVKLAECVWKNVFSNIWNTLSTLIFTK